MTMGDGGLATHLVSQHIAQTTLDTCTAERACESQIASRRGIPLVCSVSNRVQRDLCTSELVAREISAVATKNEH